MTENDRNGKEQSTNKRSRNSHQQDELRCRKIRQLNDYLRRTGKGGIVTITNGLAALDEKLLNRIMLAVSAFDAFNEDNDPYGEHDCAVITIEGVRVIWKIDYYDPSMKYGSEDPADPEKTRRVLTVMLAGEW